jgi:hypothetical protein
MSTIVTTVLRAMAFILLASDAYALEVFLKVQITGTDTPKVRVQTNLPDTTKVKVSLSNDSFDYGELIKTEVVGGGFECGPFKNNGEAIRPGTYTVRIAPELAQFQNESVQSVIGSHGEELQGPLVRKGMLGKQVFYSTLFEVKEK